MEKVSKTEMKEVWVTDLNTSLANAIRRTIGEIDTLAIKEADIYRNDSSFSDELLVHRIGLVPLENINSGNVVEMKLKIEAKEDNFDVLSDLMGDSVAVKGIPIARLNKGQGMELVAKASLGKGKEHARHIPGVLFYYPLNKISIKPEAKKDNTPAERFPKVFEFSGELKVKNEWAANFDEDDLNVPGITVTPTDKLVVVVESWGGMKCSEMILDSVKILSKNLDALKKIVK